MKVILGFAATNTMFFVIGMLITSAITRTFNWQHMAMFAVYFFAVSTGVTLGRLWFAKR